MHRHIFQLYFNLDRACLDQKAFTTLLEFRRNGMLIEI